MTNFKKKMNATVIALFSIAILSLGITSCTQITLNENNTITQTETKSDITAQEVLDAQKAWGDGIVKIGKIYLEQGDYKTVAIEHVNNFYDFQEGTVLFKPTLTSEKQFRLDFRGALSYFIGGDENYPEDYGFAIKGWSDVRWENVGIKIHGDVAMSMGNYYFTPVKGGDEVKVEYSFVYVKNEEDQVKIILHDSHMPFEPTEKNE